MDALGRPDLELAALADHRLRLVGPDPGGVDDLAGADLQVPPALQVAHGRTDDPLALALLGFTSREERQRLGRLVARTR